MRDIKFRAWDARNNEMVFSEATDCFYINTKGVLFMYAIPKSESGLETVYHKSYDVDEFTGLKDCKGVDIYKGDVMMKVMVDHSVHRCVIRYSDKHAKFVFSPVMERWDFDIDVVANPYERQSYRVIGNVQENPELMERDNEK